MAHVVSDRVKQITTSTGTGDIVVSSSVSGFDTFSNVLSNGDTTYIAIIDAANGTWETSLATWTSSTSTLARTTILASSNSGNAVNFASGNKDVFITEPASKSLLEGSSAISNAEFLKKSGVLGKHL